MTPISKVAWRGRERVELRHAYLPHARQRRANAIDPPFRGTSSQAGPDPEPTFRSEKSRRSLCLLRSPCPLTGGYNFPVPRGADGSRVKLINPPVGYPKTTTKRRKELQTIRKQLAK